MTAPGQRLKGAALSVAHAFDIEAAKARLAADGGYEIIHESAGLEIGVYVLVAPEPDHQQPTATTRSTSSLRAVDASRHQDGGADNVLRLTVRVNSAHTASTAAPATVV